MPVTALLPRTYGLARTASVELPQELPSSCFTDRISLTEVHFLKTLEIRLAD